MYQVIGIKQALALFGGLCGLLFVGWAVVAPPQDSGAAWEWWKIASGAVTEAAVLVTVLGQTPLFPLLCRLPLVRNWLPPIDGAWTAALESNWPAIQQRVDPQATDVALTPVKATVTIRARLFFVRINLESDDRYSTSKTIFVRASRDAEDGTTQLHYIYRNSTKVPAATDSSAHDGAACLNVEGPPDAIWLEGVYWTNRNWHKGLNTAGKIALRRAKQPAGVGAA